MLIDIPSSRPHRAVAVAACIGIVLVGSLLMAHGRDQIGRIPGFSTTFDCLALVAYLGTGIILLGQAKAAGQPSFMVHGATYLLISILVLGHLIAIAEISAGDPGRFSRGVPYFLWDGWHAAFGLGIALFAWAVPAGAGAPVRFLPTAFSTLAAATLVVSAVPLAAGFLPPTARALLPHAFGGIGDELTSWAVLAIDAGALVLVVWRGRATDIGLWVCVATFAATLGFGVTAFGGPIYSVAWYAGHLLNLATGLIVLIALTGELLMLYTRTIATNHDLLNQSITDPLTGVGNRRAFDIALEIECRRARREAIELSLLIVDLDDFKQVNDRYGHPAGDKYLIEVAQ